MIKYLTISIILIILLSYLYKLNKNKFIKYSIIAITVIVLPFIDAIPFTIYFNYLCEFNANSSLSQVNYVDGYLDLDRKNGCTLNCASHFLVKNKYKYMEFYVDKKNNTIINEPGYYKIWLEKNNNDDCGVYFNEIKNQKIDESHLPYKGYCYGIKKITKPESIFSAEMIFNENINSIMSMLEIESKEIRIKKHDNIIASNKTYNNYGTSYTIRKLGLYSLNYCGNSELEFFNFYRKALPSIGETR